MMQRLPSGLGMNPPSARSPAACNSPASTQLHLDVTAINQRLDGFLGNAGIDTEIQDQQRVTRRFGQAVTHDSNSTARRA